MPDEYVDARISDLTAADSISDDDLFVLEQSATAKKLPGLILKNMATNAGTAAGAAAGQAFVQAAEDAADDAQDAAEAAAQAASDAAGILDNVEAAGAQALADIEDAADDSLADIAAANTSALSNINTAKTAATDAIASEKTEALAEIDSAVEEVESYAYDIEGLKDLQNEKTVTGTQITVEDAAPLNAKKVLLTLKPHQDLHGYDHPWPAGGGPNFYDGEYTLSVKMYLNPSTHAVALLTGGPQDNRSIYVPCEPNTTYLIRSGMQGTIRVGTFSVEPVLNTVATVYKSVASTSDPTELTITSGESDVYLYIQFFIDSDISAYGTTLERCLNGFYYSAYENICPIEGYTGVEVNKAGINIWDEEWELGSLGATGAEIASSGRIRSKNYIKVKSGETYYCSASMQIWIEAFDKNKTILPAIFDGTYYRYINGLAFVIPDGVSYIRFVAFGSTYNNDISINYPATDTNYHKSEVQKIIANICINQWDEEYLFGYYNSSGVYVSASNQICTKNMIPVVSGKGYYIVLPVVTSSLSNSGVCYYDKNQALIERISLSSHVITTPSNAAYIHVNFGASYGATYKNDISINYPASFTDYSPYTGNDVAYSGTIDLGTGKMVLDGATLNLGIKTWSYITSGSTHAPYFQAPMSGVKYLGTPSNTVYGICSMYKTVARDTTSFIDKTITFDGNSSEILYLNVKDSSFTDAVLFKEYVNGQMLFYPLATPITIQLTPQQLQMLKGLNYIWTDADDMELEYCYVKDGKSVVVGNAEQLLSKEMVNDQEPYLFRASGGNGADREYDTLVGGTIAHNQLVKTLRASASAFYGLEVTNNDNGSITISGTPTTTALAVVAEADPVVIGHKLLIMGGTNAIRLRGYMGRYFANCDSGNGLIISAELTNETTLAVVFANTTTAVNETLWPICSDLTADFGSTIADYAYSLEQATAGSGIAWLKKYGFLTKPYYQYNAGELMSVKTTRHKMVGFNMFDGECTGSKTIDPATGAVISGIFAVANHYIKCKPNTQYWYGGSIKPFYYDANKNFVGTVNGGFIPDRVLATPDNCYYILLLIRSVSHASDACLNLSKTTGTPKNGDYVAYTSQEYDLGSDELRGLFKLDNGNLYADGDIKTPDGTITRKYGIVDLGTLTYAYNSNYGFQSADALTNIKPTATNDDVANALCANRIVGSYNTLYGAGTSGNYIAVLTTGKIAINSALTDPAAFKTAMSGVYLVYELATPTIEQADPFEPLQVLDPYGTEEYVDDREVPIPVGHDTNYPVNLRAEIERVMKEVPPPPASNGTYILKVTVASGVPTYSWVAQ